MDGTMEPTTKHFNTTTDHISPSNPRAGLPAYILISLVMVILTGCVVAVVIYIRRKMRLENLRHRLIPLYRYDSREDDTWEGGDKTEEEELTEPLYKDGKLSLTSDYGT